MLHKTNIFEARTRNYWTYRVPSLLVTRNGVVLAATEARPGHGGDWNYNDVLLRRSLDGVIINPSETVAVELSDGCVLLNLRSESREDRRLVSISDDGATGWSTPRLDTALLEPVCFGSILKLTQPSLLSSSRAKHLWKI